MQENKFDQTNKWHMHVIYKALCFDVAQGRMNGAPNETNDICTTQHLCWRMTQKLLWDFDTQTDHLISTRRPDHIIINDNNNKRERERERERERTCKIMGFAVPVNHRVKLKKKVKKRINTLTLLEN